jgi:integrase/recombinase XerD
MRKLPKLITQEEFEKLFSYTLNTKKKNRKQYAISMLLGFEAGMRISEIVGLIDFRHTELVKPSTSKLSFDYIVPPLTKESVDLAQNTIRIESGKGQKDRIVPLPKRFNKAAFELLPIKLSRRALQWWITKIGKEQLNKDITFHTLRHGFGSHLAGKGVALHEIQMLMGHSRLDTTGIYLHANPKKAIDDAREVF